MIGWIVVVEVIVLDEIFFCYLWMGEKCQVWWYWKELLGGRSIVDYVFEKVVVGLIDLVMVEKVVGYFQGVVVIVVNYLYVVEVDGVV